MKIGWMRMALPAAIVFAMTACTSAASPAASNGPATTSTASAAPVVIDSSAPASPAPSPSASPPPGGSSDGPITGTWEGSWQNDPQWGSAKGGFTMTVTQDGDKFSGTIDVTGPTCVRKGTVSGTIVNEHISMGWIATGIRDVAYEGTLADGGMSGTWTATACGIDQTISGTWSAKKGS